MIMLFTLAYLPSMVPRQIGTRTTCRSDKYLLNDWARSNCASRQTDPEQMGHKPFSPKHILPVQTSFK